MNTVTLDINATARALCDKIFNEARRSAEQYHAIPESARRDLHLDPPTMPREEDILKQALDVGVADLLHRRSPNAVIALRSSDIGHRYKRGDVYSASVDLPIGAEVLSMLATSADGPNWDVVNLTFGTVNLLSSYGTGPVPLADLTAMTVDDLLSVFKDKQVKVHVTASVHLWCKQDDVTCDGYRLYVHLGEQVCALEPRLKPVEHHSIYPCQRTPFRRIIALAQDTPLTVVKAVLAALRTAVRQPRVWPDATVSLLSVGGNAPVLIEVMAHFQAASEADAAQTREGLLFGLLEAVESTGAQVVPTIGHV